MDIKDYFMPYSLIAVDHGVPVFSLRDINLYGLPDLFGVNEYIVLDDPTESCPFVLDFQAAWDRRGALRPIHRYSQEKRFELLIKKFLGGNFSEIQNDEILLTVAMECSWDRELVWNSIRAILKTNGWSRYYDNIPSILNRIGYEYKIKCSSSFAMDEIVNDFKKLTFGFQKSTIGSRKYMINYRFIALKLMERHGVVFEYLVPKLQTIRKFEEFEALWQTLEKFLD